MSRSTTLLPLSPSFTSKRNVRVSAEGSSLMFSKATDCKALWKSATGAVPPTPVPAKRMLPLTASYWAIMVAGVVKVNTSSPGTKLSTSTLAKVSVGLSISVIIKLPATCNGPSFSVYEVVGSMLSRTGGSLIASTEIETESGEGSSNPRLSIAANSKPSSPLNAALGT